MNLVEPVWSGLPIFETRDKMHGNLEQRLTIKFCVKLKKTKQEAYGMLKESHGDEQMSQASFYRWFNRTKKAKMSSLQEKAMVISFFDS